MNMADSKTDLLSLLNSRRTLGEKFAKDYVKEVENSLDDYNLKSFEKQNNDDLFNKLQVPYIFSTTESALPSMFEQFPEIYMYQGGKKDAEFTEFANNIWNHLEKKLDIKAVVESAGFTFSLAGLSGARWGWETETELVPEDMEQPVLDESGQPVIGEDGRPVTQTVTVEREVIVKDLPYIRYFEYDKVYFSPESKFVTFDKDNTNIPYIVFEEVIDKDSAEYIYGTTIEDTEEIDLSDIDSDLKNDENTLLKNGINKSDLERVHIFHYYGQLPKKEVGDSWRPFKVFYVPFVKSKTLAEPVEMKNKPVALLGNYGSPDSFYKFGDGYTLRELEKDISFGRSTMMDYRDKLSTKVAVPHGSEFDEDSFKSPKQFSFVRFIGDKYPQYITPPAVPDVVPTLINHSREDVQLTSGQLDISRGGSSSTVDTATGQKIFQGVHEKRINRKREKIGSFLTALAENLLVLCGEKWDVDTFSLITDIDPQEIEEKGFAQKLTMIGETYDVYIDIENVINNKEARAAQAIAMYRELKDNPVVNQEELILKLMKIGFEEKDVDRFLSQELPPEKLMVALQQLAQMGLLDPNMAEQIAMGMQQMLSGEQGQGEGEVGRPMTQNPIGVVEKSMPGSDSNQIQAQNAAAYKQTGVPKK